MSNVNKYSGNCRQRDLRRYNNDQSSETEVFYKLKVQTNLPGDYWIRVRRNNRYEPYRNLNQEKDKEKDNNGWHVVGEKKSNKPIYYWALDGHNLFDKRDKRYKLYFYEPDANHIDILDQTSYMAMDGSGKLCLLHNQLKHKGMKMNPMFFIARGVQQMKDALKYVKYCIVKVENNEQKLIEDTELLNVPDHVKKIGQ